MASNTATSTASGGGRPSKRNTISGSFAQYTMPFAAMYVASYIDASNSNTVWLTRTAFVAAVGAFLYIIMLLRRSIASQNDATIVKYMKKVKVEGKRKPRKKEIEQTVAEYDAEKLATWSRTTLFMEAFVLFLHVVFDMYTPLLISLFTTPVTVLDSPLVQIHLLGRPATGDLARPFTEEVGFTEVRWALVVAQSAPSPICIGLRAQLFGSTQAQPLDLLNQPCSPA